MQRLRAGQPFAAIVADMNMPAMNGVQFLATVKTLSPDSTRIMLTGNADQASAVAALNTGEVFRFLTKPCDAEQLRQVLTLALRQHELVVTEKYVLERTVRGSVKALAEVLALARPEAFGRVGRLRKLTRQLSSAFSTLEP